MAVFSNIQLSEGKKITWHTKKGWGGRNMVQSKEQNKSPEIDPKKKSSNPSMNYLAKNSKLVHCA